MRIIDKTRRWLRRLKKPKFKEGDYVRILSYNNNKSSVFVGYKGRIEKINTNKKDIAPIYVIFERNGEEGSLFVNKKEIVGIDKQLTIE